MYKCRLEGNGNTPADKDMLTRWLTGPANMSDPILRTDTGIPSVPRAEVDFSPEKIFAIRMALEKPNAKVFFPLLSLSLEIVEVLWQVFWTPLPAQILNTFCT
jgi:hypothetical protein